MIHPSISRMEQYRLRKTGAIKTPMPTALCDPDALREDLAELVETFNATADPLGRARLYQELTTIRAKLGATKFSKRETRRGPH